MRQTLKLIILILCTLILTTACSKKEVPPDDYQPDSNAPRSEISATFKWNLEDLFKSKGKWKNAYKEVENKIESLIKYDGQLNTPVSLRKCLDEYFNARLLMNKVSLYADLKVVEDEDVEEYQQMFQRTSSLTNEFNKTTSFIKQTILRMNDNEARGMVVSSELAPYASYIEELRRRSSRILSEEAEGVLVQVGDDLFSGPPPSDIELIFKATMRDIELPKIKDENGNEVQLTLSNYPKFRSSKNREVRKETVEGFFKALKDYENILAAILAGEIKRDVLFSKLRRYNRAIDAYLDVDNVDPKVVDNLIDTIHNNLKPLHRYVELRKRMLGIPDIHIYDLYTPLVKTVDTKVTYDDATKMITEALKPLGESYLKPLTEGIAAGSGWVDIYPNKGKESGAFSTSVWGLHPFIKMNYMDRMNDVSTLAHEFGHAMHSYLNMNVQPLADWGYSIFTAEIASTFNEMLLTNYLTEKYKDDDEMLLYILGTALETIRTTIYRQTLFAEFEKKIHEFAEKGTPLTAELFNKTYIDLIKEYYGPGLEIGADDDIEWAYIPYFYHKYYAFTYATGLSSGIALAQRTLTDGAPARDLYLAMLKEPATAAPLKILKKAGVDLTKPDTIEAAINLMDQTITEIEGILKMRK